MRYLALVLSMATAISAQALTGGAYSTNPRYSAIIKIRGDFGPERSRANCTGTFISPRHILTAGHCLLNTERGEPMSPIKIELSIFPSMNLFWRPISFDLSHAKFEIHPNYIENPHAGNEDDVGIVILDRPYTKKYLKLASPTPRAGSSVLLTGYGCDKEEKKWSTDFKVAKVSLASVDALLKIMPGGIDLCEGDSGGAVLTDGAEGLRVVGVSSYSNLFRGFFGGSKDRAVRLDKEASARAWVNEQLKR